MTDQTIEIPHNAEVLITITVNPCHCDEPVPICDLPPAIPPVVYPEPIPVTEIPIVEPVTVETPTPEVVPTSEPIPTVPELPPVEPEPIVVTEPIPVIETPIEQPAPPVVIPSVPEVEPTPTTEPVQLIPEVIPTPVTEAQPEPNPVVIPVPEPIVIPPITPPVEPIAVDPPVAIPVPTPVEAHTCELDSTISLTEFTKRLIAATQGLLYPSESNFPIEVLSKGLSTKMPTIKGIEVRSLDRVFPTFLREVDQQTGNLERASIAARWQALYDLIKKHSAATAWHYPVKQNRYTHELIVIMLHPQGTVGLRIKLVET